MATSKPNPIAKNIEIILAIAGLVIFLLVLIISISKVPAVSSTEVNKQSQEYKTWYSEKQNESVDVPEPEDMIKKLKDLTDNPAEPKRLDGWSWYPHPSILVPKSKEKAFFIGTARLTAEPGFNKAKVIVKLEDLDKTISRISALSGTETEYRHLDADKVVVKIYRGEKKSGAADGEIIWEDISTDARSAAGEGMFILEDRRDIYGVTELYYKADVMAAEPFLNAEKLGREKIGPPLEPEEPAPMSARTNTDEEVLKVVTKSPWTVEVAQTWGGSKVTLIVINQKTGEKYPLTEDLGPGEKIGDTTFRLINILHLKRFSIVTNGTISRIELEMAVWNSRTGGDFVGVGEKMEGGKRMVLVWAEDPFNPIGDNRRIIEHFTRYALAALASTGGGLNLGGAKFDEKDNFITNLLWRAIRTYPGGKGEKKKDAFGRTIKKYQYQPVPDEEPVKLIPFKFTEDVDNDESLVLQIDPHDVNQKRVSYFAEYSRRTSGGDEDYTSGPYEVGITGFDATAEDKIGELIRVIRNDVKEKHKDDVFDENARTGLVPLGDAMIYDKKDIGLLSEMYLGKDIRVLVQYCDENIAEGSMLLEAPVTEKDRYVKPDVVTAPPDEAKEFRKKMRNLKTFSSDLKFDNIDDCVNNIKTLFDVKISIDQSIREIENVESIGFSVKLDKDNRTTSLKELMPSIVEAFNKTLAANGIDKKIKDKVRSADILLIVE